MDKQEYQEYVHRRKRRYMAQILEAFEEIVEPHLQRGVAQDFKGTVRRKLHAFAIDVNQVISLKPGEEMNGVAVDLRDRIYPDAAPTTTQGAD